MPLPFATPSIYPGVVTFSRSEIPEAIRQLESNAPFFPNDGSSVPFYGTVCSMDSSTKGQHKLSLLANRSTHAFSLLVAFPEHSAEDTEILTPAVRKARVQSALQNIDDCDGKSLKDGASNKSHEFFVDKDGRPSVTGTLIHRFELSLTASRLDMAPLVQASLSVLKATNGTCLVTDPVIISQWPRCGPKGSQIHRILVPSRGQSVAMHLVHSCMPFQAASLEVKYALDTINQPARADLVIYRDVVDFSDGTALCTFNPILMSYLLIMCPSFGSTEFSLHSYGLETIRNLPTRTTTSFSSQNEDSDMMEVASNQNRPATTNSSAWSKPKKWGSSTSSRTSQVSKIIESPCLLEPRLLNVLPARAVYQRDENYIGPSCVLSFPYNAIGMDYGHIQGQVAWMIIEHLYDVPGISPYELTFERWEPVIGVLSTWSPEGSRISKLLVQVRPGTCHALVVDALHGKYLPCDPRELQALWPQYSLCACSGCQQHRRDTTGSGCIDCAGTNHLARDGSCPRLIERREFQNRRREQAAAKESTVSASSYRTPPGPAPKDSVPVGQSLHKRSASSLVGDYSNSDSDDNLTAPPSSLTDSGTSQAQSSLPEAQPISQPSAKVSPPQLPATIQSSSQDTAGSAGAKGRGRGRGMAPAPGKASQSLGAGRGSGKPTVFPWLCPFCNEPSGTSQLHNSKLCNKPLKLTPPSELSTSRCAFCDHHHSFVDCTMLHDQRLGISVMPQAYVDIAERLGYQIGTVGNRRFINYQAALTTRDGPAKPGLGSQSAVSLDANKVSTLSQELRDALCLIGQKEQALSDQVSSLQGVVTMLSEGQGSLQKQQEALQGQLAAQAESSLAIVRSLAKLRTDFEETRTKHEQSFAAGMDRYKATMEEFKKQLGVVDTGVKGPHDNSMQQ